MNKLIKRAFIEYTMGQLATKLANLDLSAVSNMPAAAQIGNVPAKPGFNWSKFRQGAMADLGPAAGSVLGAGVANAYGINPIAGAAAGYGLGAIPEIIHGIRFRGLPH